MANHRSERLDAKPHLTTLVVLAALALGLPGGDALADKQSSSPGVAAIASAIERGIFTVQEGVVSWYGTQFHDRKTASGERFDSGAMTMAHPKLPFGTMVRVTNLKNKRSVVLRVNDRGPTQADRVGDVSAAAARKLGMSRSGVVDAKIEAVTEAKPRPSKKAK